MSDVVADSVRPRRPPAAGTKVALTGASATNAAQISEGGRWSFAIGVAFSIAFGAADVDAPTDTKDFVAGVYDFWITPGVNDYFRIMPNASGSMTYWKSGFLKNL